MPILAAYSAAEGLASTEVQKILDATTTEVASAVRRRAEFIEPLTARRQCS